MNYTTLKQSQVEELSDIISNNYKNARLNLPILSEKYESPELCANKINKYIDDSNFIVAVDSGKIAGFMSGFPISNFKGTARGVLSIPSLHGVGNNYDKNHLYSELYKKISDLWVNSGCYTHGIMLYANDESTITNWVYNGFGMVCIDAVRPLEKIDLPNIDDNLLIRQAEVSDLPYIVPLLQGMDNHLYSSPIFLYNQFGKNYQEEYSGWLKINGNKLWIAESNNNIVGCLKANTSEVNLDELDDGYTMGINGAYVLPEYRGKHIMVKLLNTATNWAIKHGLKRCSTDFESANLEGRRFWLKYFTPCCFSMIRRIDERNR